MDWIEFAAVVVAVVSASISVFFSGQSRKHERRSAVNDYRADLRAWAFRAMRILARLEDATERSDANGIADILAELSSVIEEGRLFFPNSAKSDLVPVFSNSTKIRGYRDKKLDPLVVAHRVYRPRSGDPDVDEKVHVIRRLRIMFTASMQEFLDPTDHRRTIEDLTRLEQGETTEKILQDIAAGTKIEDDRTRVST